MAVYTRIAPEAIEALLQRYTVGSLRSAKGIAEGVENSNYLVETTRARFILTLYESRVDARDLPFFIDLLGHLKARGAPVPAFIADRTGRALQTVAGRPACLIEFLSGVSPAHPTPAQARAAGAALATLHAALTDFTGRRANALGRAAWAPLAAACGPAGLDGIHHGLATRIADALAHVDAGWPHDLPIAAIHADLFPDNVLMLDDRVTGLIDFYFACTDVRAYDVAVMHAAWCFDDTGARFDPALSEALLAGYRAGFSLSDAEWDALPILAEGACLRFLLTRAYDWINTPADALVTRKDPLAFLRRLDFYADRRHDNLFIRGAGL